ncbi:Hypothetical_protein [Hexamita inflata]|uniref:Hypothetical_protein n=1 Tax=Hexamita inflata TaxID=28002 RepID=A0AA86U2E5_9EUKA|nr:Hypothetical protein HINF_LOCUS25469 [Hexamita inflata]
MASLIQLSLQAYLKRNKKKIVQMILFKKKMKNKKTMSDERLIVLKMNANGQHQLFQSKDQLQIKPKDDIATNLNMLLHLVEKYCPLIKFQMIYYYQVKFQKGTHHTGINPCYFRRILTRCKFNEKETKLLLNFQNQFSYDRFDYSICPCAYRVQCGLSCCHEMIILSHLDALKNKYLNIDKK